LIDYVIFSPFLSICFGEMRNPIGVSSYLFSFCMRRGGRETNRAGKDPKKKIAEIAARSTVTQGRPMHVTDLHVHSCSHMRVRARTKGRASLQNMNCTLSSVHGGLHSVCAQCMGAARRGAFCLRACGVLASVCFFNVCIQHTFEGLKAQCDLERSTSIMHICCRTLAQLPTHSFICALTSIDQFVLLAKGRTHSAMSALFFS